MSRSEKPLNGPPTSLPPNTFLLNHLYVDQPPTFLASPCEIDSVETSMNAVVELLMLPPIDQRQQLNLPRDKPWA
jgi:hypothetical protein